VARVIKNPSNISSRVKTHLTKTLICLGALAALLLRREALPVFFFAIIDIVA
jgi:hypothetical protein